MPSFENLKQGTLTEGEGSVQFTSLHRSAAFDNENVIYDFTKQASFMSLSFSSCALPYIIL